MNSDGIRFDSVKVETQWPVTARPLAGRFSGSPRFDKFFNGSIHSFLVDPLAMTPVRSRNGKEVGNRPVYESLAHSMAAALKAYNKRTGLSLTLKAAYDFDSQRFYVQAVETKKKPTLNVEAERV